MHGLERWQIPSTHRSGYELEVWARKVGQQLAFQKPAQQIVVAELLSLVFIESNLGHNHLSDCWYFR